MICRCGYALSLCLRTRKKRTQMLAMISGCIFFVILHFILTWEAGDANIFANLDINIPTDFIPVIRREREIFPTNGSHRIPKIIHQTWKNTDIPSEFVSFIKSWLETHPDWEYWLWTDDTARQLIAEKYSSFLDIFDGYREPIRRADALRYIVLYEYGGVYVDLDMEALTTLEPLILKYSCFIGQEPYEHPVLDTNFEQLLINALIGCRKGHPFMKMLIDNLPMYSVLWHYLDSTGPHFVTVNYHQYLHNHPFPAYHENGLYVAPSEYFYPTVDPDKIHYMFSRCNDVGQLTKLQVKACRNLKFRSLPENKFDPLAIAFTNHHWYHTYLRTLISDTLKNYKSIFALVPKVKIYPSNSKGLPVQE